MTLKNKIAASEEFLSIQTQDLESLRKKAVTNRVERRSIAVEHFVSNYKDKKTTKKFDDIQLLSQRLHMSVEDIKMVFHSLRTSMPREFKRMQNDNACVSMESFITH